MSGGKAFVAVVQVAEQMRPIFQAIFKWAADNPPPYRKDRGKAVGRRQKPER